MEGGKSGIRGVAGDVRDGRFELHGLDPDAEVPVYFLDSRHELGATLLLSGKSLADGPVTVAPRALRDREGTACGPEREAGPKVSLSSRHSHGCHARC